MKLNKIFKSAVIASAALVMTGCASDYLDTPVHGTIPAEEICKTTTTARQAVLGICGRSMCGMWSSNIPFQAYMQGENGISGFYGEVPGSDSYANYIYEAMSNPAWSVIYNQEQNWLSSGNYVWSSYMWTYAYACIAQINEVIAQIDNAEGPDDEREFTKGQAYALRAHFYWRLLQCYAPRWQDSDNGEALTIVLRTTMEEEKDKPVTTMNAILDQCYSDLDTAIASFQAAGSYKRTQTYEPTLNIAYGIYARVAALKEDWQTCKTMAHNARQGYRLATTDEAMSGYMSFNNNEWLWSSSFNQIDNGIYANWCTFFACNAVGPALYRCNTRINIDLYRQIPEDDVRRDWFLTGEKLPGIRYAMFYNPNSVNPVNQQITSETVIKAARTWLDEHQATYHIAGGKAYDGTGNGDAASYILCDGTQVKFWCDGETGQTAMSFPPFMRATEMYLYEAEAMANLGETTDAQQLMNEINTPRNPNYNCTASGQDLIDEVRLYRRIELWGEGFCWFDLKRWNMPSVRRAFESRQTDSGNIPQELACDVPTTQNQGWRYGISRVELIYNTAITLPIPK